MNPRRTLIVQLALIGFVLMGCRAFNNADDTAGETAQPNAEESPVQTLTDPLKDWLTPLWGNSAYWDEWPFEECAYYGSSTAADGERQYFDWFVRVNKRQEGDGQGFVISHYSPRDSCHAVYRYNRPDLLPRGKANHVSEADHFSHPSINFALRASAFTPGSEIEIPLTSGGNANLRVVEGEELFFGDERYDCHLLLLEHAQQVDSFWYDKQYPNRLVRVTDGKSRLMLKSVVRR